MVRASAWPNATSRDISAARSVASCAARATPNTPGSDLLTLAQLMKAENRGENHQRGKQVQSLVASMSRT